MEGRRRDRFRLVVVVGLGDWVSGGWVGVVGGHVGVVAGDLGDEGVVGTAAVKVLAGRLG